MGKGMIRFATKEDMSAVLGLIQELATYEKEPDAVEVTVEDLQCDGFGKRPLFTCFVLEIDGQVEGMALVYFRYSTWKGKAMHLEDFVVREELRGQGYGKALFRRAMEFAQENQVNRVAWEVLDWNKNALNFYENSGANILKDWYLAQFDKANLHLFLSKK